MSDLRVAKRYAKALMDFSIEKKILDKVFADMTLIFNTCEENRDLTLALRSPIIKFDKKRAILQAIFKGKSIMLHSGFWILFVEKIDLKSYLLLPLNLPMSTKNTMASLPQW